MVDTAGKKLKQARLRKQLSLEEVARTTKIRVPRLVDLENDDYTNFPSMAYVRGFLFIYAKYVGIDVSEYTASLGSSATSVGVGDYEYLSNAPDPADNVVHRKLKRSIWPLVLLAILLVIGAFVGVISYFVVNAGRLGNLDELAQKHLSEKAESGYPAPVRGRSSTPAPQFSPPKAASRSLRGDGLDTEPVPAQPRPAESPSQLLPEVRKAQPVVPEIQAPSPGANPLLEPAPKEVVITAVKKTWVKITKDSPDSAPIYEDWLYPDTLPLRLRGARFFVQMSDPAGVQITKNGAPQPIDQSSIIIQ